MAKALIISDGGAFSKMLEIELSLIGVDSDIRDTLDFIEGVDIVVADLDFCVRVGIEDFSGALAVGYFSGEESVYANIDKRCVALLRRPFLTSSFRQIISEELSLDGGYYPSLAYDGKKADSGIQMADVAESLSLDDGRRAALYGDKIIPLSDFEYKTISLLIERRGEAVSREEISSLLGGEGNMAEVYICHLRRKIDNALGKKFIYTVRGKGYMIKKP